jgi:hypothetical protein
MIKAFEKDNPQTSPRPHLQQSLSEFFETAQRLSPTKMGRTLPSTTQIVFNLIAELELFYLALRRSDQLILDKFFEAILQHRVPSRGRTIVRPAINQ